jgi:hypothetical protein
VLLLVVVIPIVIALVVGGGGGVDWALLLEPEPIYRGALFTVLSIVFIIESGNKKTII